MVDPIEFSITCPHCGHGPEMIMQLVSGENGWVIHNEHNDKMGFDFILVGDKILVECSECRGVFKVSKLAFLGE